MEKKEKFFKKITSLRKLKKEAKRRTCEILGYGCSCRTKKYIERHLKIGRYKLWLYGEKRKQANREYERLMLNMKWL